MLSHSNYACVNDKTVGFKCPVCITTSSLGSLSLQQGANDVSNFDEDFTKEPAVLTPVAEEVLATMDQELFKEFSYTNPNMTT